LAPVQAATAQRVEFPSADRAAKAASRSGGPPVRRASEGGKLTWAGSILGWDRACSRRQNREKRPFCLYRKYLP
jgi:hypothetical protein